MALAWRARSMTIPEFEVLLFLIGVAIASPESARFMAIIGAFFLGGCVLAIPLNLRLSRKYQRQIDELDALLREEGRPNRG